MRLSTVKNALADRLPGIAVGVYVLILLAIVFGLSLFLFRASSLIDDGRVASGLVVDGESGTTPGDAYYCTEKVEFSDEGGHRYRTSRSCGTNPEKGARVTVHYDPNDPTHNYVEGDDRSYNYVVALLVLLSSGVWGLIRHFA